MGAVQVMSPVWFLLGSSIVNREGKVDVGTGSVAGRGKVAVIFLVFFLKFITRVHPRRGVMASHLQLGVESTRYMCVI